MKVVSVPRSVATVWSLGNALFYVFQGLRFVFATILLWAGSVKILSPSTFLLSLYDYQVLSPDAARYVAVVLPWMEYGVGSCLLIGLWLDGAWIATATLMAVFVVAQLSVLYRGLSIPCGCGLEWGAMIGAFTVTRSLLLLIGAAFGAWSCISSRRLRSIGSASTQIETREIEACEEIRS